MSPFLSFLLSMPWASLVGNLFGGVTHSWLQSGLMWSLLRWMLLLPLDHLPHLLFPLLLEPRSLSLPSWIRFSLCMLILVVVLTLSLMRCVRWMPRLVASIIASLALVVLLILPHLSLLRSLFWMVEMMMMLLALRLMMRWLPLSDSLFVTHENKEQ